MFICCYVSSTVFVFFFFKQKTAYEMRISDWSSDVCSSDLQIGPGVAVAIGVFGLRAGETALEDLAHHREIVIGRGLLDIELAILALAEALRPRDDHRAERVGDRKSTRLNSSH